MITQNPANEIKIANVEIREHYPRLYSDSEVGFISRAKNKRLFEPELDYAFLNSLPNLKAPELNECSGRRNTLEI